MKKQNFILLIIFGLLIIIVDSYLVFNYYFKTKNIENDYNDINNVLMEVEEGGAWGGPKTVICQDGKFFSNNILSGQLDSSTIKYLKNEFGKASFTAHYSSDIADAFDAYSTFDVNYYGSEPQIKLDGSVYYKNIYADLDKATKYGDWQQIRNFLTIFSKLRQAVERKTKITEVLEIAPEGIIRAQKWIAANDLFLFNNNERYSMYADNVIPSWPLLNKAQLEFIDTIDYPVKTYKTKRDNYFIKDNELFLISVNNSEGKVYFEYIPSSKSIISADKIKEFDQNLYNEFENFVDTYKPGNFQRDLYVTRYLSSGSETDKIYDEFKSKQYFYAEKDGDVFILPVSFSKKQQTSAYNLENMEMMTFFNVKNAIEAEAWQEDGNLFPFDLIYQIGEINYALDDNLSRNRAETTKDQKDFGNNLDEGITYFVINNRLFIFQKYLPDNSLNIKRFTIDDIYEMVPGELLNVLGEDFDDLYQRVASGESIEETFKSTEEQLKAFNLIPNNLAYFMKNNDKYKILISNTNFVKQIAIPYKDIDNSNELCNVKAQADDLPIISAGDIK